jgi:hypothetical protein
MSELEFKVLDLINLYEAIEKDKEELRTTLRLLPEDREYTIFIHDSLFSEIEKLDHLQKEILSLEISLDDEETPEKLERVEMIPPLNPGAPEIIITPKKNSESTTEKIKPPRRY